MTENSDTSTAGTNTTSTTDPAVIILASDLVLPLDPARHLADSGISQQAIVGEYRTLLNRFTENTGIPTEQIDAQEALGTAVETLLHACLLTATDSSHAISHTDTLVSVDPVDSSSRLPGLIGFLDMVLSVNIRRNVRYQVSLDYDDNADNGEGFTIDAAQSVAGVRNLLTDLAPLVRTAGTDTDPTRPWICLHDRRTGASTVYTVQLPRDNNDNNDTTAYTVHVEPMNLAALISHGVAVVSGSAVSGNSGAAAPVTGQRAGDRLHAATTTANTDSGTTTDTDDTAAGDQLLAVILRNLAATVESTPLSETDLADQATVDDRTALMQTLVGTATVLEEHHAHPEPQVRELLITNLTNLAHRAEAIAEPATAEPVTDAPDTDDANAQGMAVDPAQLGPMSMAMAAELAAARLRQLGNGNSNGSSDGV